MKIIKTIIFVFFSVWVYAQTPQKRLTSKDLIEGERYVIDTVIANVTYYKAFSKTANNALDIKSFSSIDIKDLKDLPEAAEIDKKWLEVLYSNSLYDTIYKSVSELKYDPVDYPELTTDTLKQRLARLNAKTPFNVEYNPLLESVIKNYLKHRKRSFKKLIGLSEFYFPMFEEAFAKNDIPLEMKYLSIVESALKPRAKSRVGATGLWQFMFTTGKEYDLNVSSYVDERSDPLQSTDAAAQYLSRLYKIFGDWDLALAAYNSGPGNVSKAIRRSGGYKNYWNIRPHLPRETAGYIPAFLATMYIFEYADEHGITPQNIDYQYVKTDTVHVKQMISLEHVSEITAVKIEELQFLNPAYKLDIIPKIEGKMYTLTLPRKAIGVFVNNEDKIYAYAKSEFNKREKPLPELTKVEAKTRYRVRSGDYLGKIASKFGVKVSQIKRWNGLRNNNLKVGQRLTIFPKKPRTVSSRKPKTKVNSKGKKTYTVQSGDSFWTIAQKFPGVSVENIKEWNDISNNTLKIGKVLIVSK